MGAKLVHEVANKTSDVAGDGTTTATVLAEAIFAEGLKNITAGANPMAVKRGIDEAVEVAVESIKKLSVKVRGKDDIAKVATISSNGDQAVGKMLSEAFEKVGKDGVIEIEKVRASRRRGSTSRVCSSTRASSRPTSSPTRPRSRPSSKIRRS